MVDTGKPSKMHSSFFGDEDDDRDDQRDGRRRGSDRRSSGGGPFRFGFIYILLGIVAISLFSQYFMSMVSGTRNVSYTEFLQHVEAGGVDHAKITEADISYTLKNGQSLTTRIPYYDPSLMDLLKANNVKTVGAPKKASFLELALQFLPLVFFIYLIIMFSRQSKSLSGGGMFGGMTQSLAREYKPNGKDVVKFSDVAGQKEAKEELSEVVEFLKNPKRFVSLGARIPKGVLLVGPPGTGKTLIARAVAGESGVTFLYTSGSDFVEMFVGMGAARVRDLFAEARKKSPCIIFIDELDAVGRSRGTGIGGGHDEREQTLNQILVEMDGFSTDKGVIIMAATNRQDVLDDALLRPGRFDRRVTVELPDVREREAILQLHFAKIKTDSSLDFKKIARATPGSSGADLANLANESALLAARNSKPFVTMAEVEQARDKMILGAARASMVMSPEAKTATAYHEAGHTLLHYYVEGVDPLHKVTIIPHGYALGVTISLPEDDSYSKNKQELLGRIKTAMGGYVAEELVYGQTTTGVSNDIKQATAIAQKMVTELGMSKLGFVNYSDDDHPLFLGRDINQRKSFSEETAKTIDEEVRSILESCLSEARKILSEHRSELDRLAQCLVEKETLDDNQVREIIGLGQTSKNSDLFSTSLGKSPDLNV